MKNLLMKNILFLWYFYYLLFITVNSVINTYAELTVN